ncbi:MAG TPA: (d)CMP kinase [Bacteroidales bacterium]|nr:(d)CMP kinase [Bacteroidales bacterium]
MNKKLIIAVDGYSSCGKSTFAKAIARELNYIFIDSGAMYRAVTLYCMRKGYIDRSTVKEDKINNSMADINIRFRYNPDIEEHETYLNGENVEEEIRQVEVSSLVSIISKIRSVRERLVEMQREIGIMKSIVMDGRDIGTVVFPDADIKIFMTASPEIRAERRYKELIGKGVKVNYDEVLNNISERDTIDSGREISPLKKAEDAYILDNSEMTVNQQMVWFRDILSKKSGDEGRN